MRKNIRVIGIDPGSRITGWGIVEEISGVLKLVDCGAIRTVSKPDTPFAQRLAHIYKELFAIISKNQVQEGAIEQVFASKNVSSALKLGQARGVAIAALAAYDLPVFDYEPTLVKKSIVGVGRADKAQVSFMVGRLLNKKVDWIEDTGDALGVAITHINTRRFMKL